MGGDGKHQGLVEETGKRGGGGLRECESGQDNIVATYIRC